MGSRYATAIVSWTPAANIGLFTVFASRLARDLRVFSFEPNPAAFACLKANAAPGAPG